jgi:hypothetical protein
MNNIKVVYSKWYTYNNKQYPFPNGTSDRIVEFTKGLAPTSEFDRFAELESRYYHNEPAFGYYFRNSNFYLHCKKNNVEMVPKVTDEAVYYYPVEIEGNTIQFVTTDDFVNTIDNDTLEHLKNGRVILLLANMVDPALEPRILEDVELFFSKLGITRITSLQGNIRYDADTSITQIDSSLALYQTANEMDRYPYNSMLGYVSDYLRETELTDQLRPMKFLSFNRFMDRCHRTGLAYLTLKHNLLPDGYFTFLCNPKDDYEGRLAQLELPTDIFADAIRSMVPREIDTKHLDRAELATFFTVINYRKDLYQNSYIHIVTETQFEQNTSPFMSEKTFRPILNLQPFIMLGNARTLNTLRILGFKTFHPFIDESYDNELDPVKRFAMIAEEIKKLGSMSIEEIHEWFLSIKDTLIFNQQLLYSYRNYNPICNLQKLN